MRQIQLRPRNRQEKRKEIQEAAKNEKKRKKNTNASKQRAKNSRAEYFRKRRLEMKTNPEVYEHMKNMERERYKRRVAEGKIKKVDAMTDREKRAIRKKRRSYAAKHYLKQKAKQLEEDPVKSVAGNLESEQKKTGRKLYRQRLADDKNKIKQLQLERRKANKRAEKYKKRAQRNSSHDNKGELTPRTKVRKFLRGKKVNDAVQKILLFGEVIEEQLKKSRNRLSAHKEKQAFSRLLGHKMIKKYKMLKYSVGFMSKRPLQWFFKPVKSPLTALREKGARAKLTLKIVKDFYSDDSNSAVSPGKREFSRGKKEKLRYLTDSQQGLYEKFCLNSSIKISYAQFCKLRPSYVVKPQVNARDTCACQKCENFKLIVSGCCKAGILYAKNGRELVNSLCCSANKSDECLSRECVNCKEKVILYKAFNPEDELVFYQWKREKVPVKAKPKKSLRVENEGKECTITVKKLVKRQVADAVNDLEESVTECMNHLRLRNHQFRVTKALKVGVGANDLVLHVDFSEAYQCKYATETQGVHFGGLRNSVTLHTGVAYSVNGTTGFCTVTDCERHDPVSIMAHLSPIIEHFLNLNPLITTLHVISDGPTSQYRNKTYFYLLTQYIAKVFPQILVVTHNYSEVGHGKGAPDGIGGVIKHIADDAVAHGTDVGNLASFLEVITKHIKNVLLTKIDISSIRAVEELMGSANLKLKAFPGTLKVHQLKWTKEEKFKVFFNALSCFDCNPGNVCSHFNIGSWKIPQNVA